MANMEKMDRVRDFLREHPEKHQQEIWLRHRYTSRTEKKHNPLDSTTEYCGVVGCFAGWGVVFEEALQGAIMWNSHGEANQISDIWGEVSSIQFKATEIFELTFLQADYLFDSLRTMEEFEAAMEFMREDPSWSPPAGWWLNDINIEGNDTEDNDEEESV